MSRLRPIALLALAVLFAAASPVSAQRRGQAASPPPPPKLEDLVKQFEAERGQPYAQRYQTLNLFGQVQTDECARYVEAIYKGDADVNIRRGALGVLGTVGTPHARDALVAAARAEKDDSMRQAALASLSRVRPLPDDRAIFAQAASPGRTLAVRLAGIVGLAAYADKDAAEALLALLAPDDPESKPAPDQQRINRGVLDQLRRMPGKAAGEVIVEKVLDQKRGRAEWLKGELLPVAVTQGALDDREDLLLDLMKERDPEVRAGAASGFDRVKPGPEAVKRLTDLLSDKSEPVAMAAAAALAKHAPKEAFDEILKVAKKSRSIPHAAAATAALGGYPDEKDAFDHLERTILKRRKPWQLVAAAVAAIRRFRQKASIEVLVEAIGEYDGRLQADIHQALEDLGGIDLSSDPEEWAGWWRAVKDGFQVPPAGAKRKGGTRGAGTVARNPSYHGNEVVSKRLCFIVDLSGSMSAPMDQEEAGSARRVDVAKAELMQVVEALSPAVYFNVIFFGSGFKAWKDTITRAAPEVKQDALAAIKGAGGMGGTNIYDPLESALLDPNVDTIYLLSDGAPGSGKFVATDDICREVRRINAGRRIAIHTIAFGMKSDLLKKLARENDGRYVEK